MTAAMVTTIAVVVLIGLVVAVVSTAGRTGVTEALSGRLVLLGYFDFASAISTLVIAFGVISLVAAGLMLPAGREFSYQIAAHRPVASARPPGMPAPPGAIEQAPGTLRPPLCEELAGARGGGRAGSHRRDDGARSGAGTRGVRPAAIFPAVGRELLDWLQASG